MSRSRRKTPIIGVCGKSEKKDKRLANRKLRRMVHVLIRLGDEHFPSIREVSNVWAWSKDGKQYLAHKKLDLPDELMPRYCLSLPELSRWLRK